MKLEKNNSIQCWMMKPEEIIKSRNFVKSKINSNQNNKNHIKIYWD